MYFMNEYEIERAVDQHHDHPVLGPATLTLLSLMVWTNANSDGWPYWPKPARAAKSLMKLICGDGTWDDLYGAQLDTLTAKDLKKAQAPIRAFRTRQNAIFAIYE